MGDEDRLGRHLEGVERGLVAAVRDIDRHADPVGGPLHPQELRAVVGDDAVDRGDHGQRVGTCTEPDRPLGVHHDPDAGAGEVVEVGVGNRGRVAVPGAAGAAGQGEGAQHVDHRRAFDGMVPLSFRIRRGRETAR